MSLRSMDTMFMRVCDFDEAFVQGAIKELLEAVDFLHTELQAVHTSSGWQTKFDEADSLLCYRLDNLFSPVSREIKF